MVKLPTPQFLVFYNGSDNYPDQVEMRLSDAFENQEVPGCLECKATMLNINLGHNREIMEKCIRLKDYSIFIAEINLFIKKGYNMRQAINAAVDSCIEKGVLKDILIRNRSEVVHMILTEYDEKKHLANTFTEGYEEGRREGIEKGIEKGIEALILDNLEENIPQERILEKLQKRFDLNQDEANEQFKKYSEKNIK